MRRIIIALPPSPQITAAKAEKRSFNYMSKKGLAGCQNNRRPKLKRLTRGPGARRACMAVLAAPASTDVLIVNLPRSLSILTGTQGFAATMMTRTKTMATRGIPS
jgi:hypothetical protein